MMMQMIAAEQPNTGDVALPLSKALVKCNGQDIIKKSSTRKNRYLIILNCLIAPAAAGRLGTLAQMDSKEPVMYMDFPNGRLKLFGTLVFPRNKYMVLKTGGHAGVLCEDVFENMIVFSEAWWVGTKEENPNEERLLMPPELEVNTAHASYDFNYGAGVHGGVAQPATQRPAGPGSQEAAEEGVGPSSQAPGSVSRPRRAATRKAYVEQASDAEEDGVGAGGATDEEFSPDGAAPDGSLEHKQEVLQVGAARTMRMVRASGPTLALDDEEEEGGGKGAGKAARARKPQGVGAGRVKAPAARGKASAGKVPGHKRQSYESDEESEDETEESEMEDEESEQAASDGQAESDADELPGSEEGGSDGEGSDQSDSDTGKKSRPQPKQQAGNKGKTQAKAKAPAAGRREAAAAGRASQPSKKRKAAVSDEDEEDDIEMIAPDADVAQPTQRTTARRAATAKRPKYTVDSDSNGDEDSEADEPSEDDDDDKADSDFEMEEEQPRRKPGAKALAGKKATPVKKVAAKKAATPRAKPHAISLISDDDDDS